MGGFSQVIGGSYLSAGGCQYCDACPFSLSFFSLGGRFPVKSWATDEMLVPEVALGFLATENGALQVDGELTHEQVTPSK
jgi:hypothetical protein